jgi:regulator of protease activity HflC (stomatin/prohibitin superfamily)
MTGQRFVVAAALVGLAVLTVVLVLSSFATIHSAQLISFQRTGDARKIVVNIVTGLGTEIAERTVREDAQTVTVTVNMRQSPGTYPAIAFYLPVVVSLKDALGDRRVLDASGNTVRDLGMYIAPGTTPQP